MEKINIVTIGGGAGTFNVLFGLKNNPQYNLAAIVNVSDSGGSTGELRDEFGILPPGDIRRAIVALSQDTGMVRKLFEYRFKKESSVSGHTIGNLLLTALSDITGSFEKGIQELSELFDIHGKVIPSTLDNIHIGVRLEDGQEIIGETHIDIPKHNADLAITDTFIVGECHINPRAREAIENADYIVIGPGDLYTSILPNILIPGVAEALQTTKAHCLYICNIMTKHGETNQYYVEDFIAVLEKYIGIGFIHSVVVNSGEVSQELLEKYKTEEKKELVRLRQRQPLHFPRIIMRDLVNEHDFIRHDPIKISRLIDDFTQGWIK